MSKYKRLIVLFLVLLFSIVLLLIIFTDFSTKEDTDHDISIENIKPIFEKHDKNPVLKTDYANMFPTVVEAQQYLKEPIDRYYMYFSAHNGQNIYLATSSKLEGPWKPFPNPIYSMEEAGLSRHISSPEVFLTVKQICFTYIIMA